MAPLQLPVKFWQLPANLAITVIERYHKLKTNSLWRRRRTAGGCRPIQILERVILN